MVSGLYSIHLLKIETMLSLKSIFESIHIEFTNKELLRLILYIYKISVKVQSSHLYVIRVCYYLVITKKRTILSNEISVLF